MSIDVLQCNTKLTDSMNFLPMPLEQFPNSFGLEELCKWYFPHLLNTKGNKYVTLPHLPHIAYYNTDDMKAEKRDLFLKWYEEHIWHVFEFQKELLCYCRSDVDILPRRCLAFRRMLKTVTSKDENPGIDPFENCITIASVCNLVFRRNYLDHESIGIIPSHGYHPQQKQSMKALKWLQYLSKGRDINIIYSLSFGQVKEQRMCIR